MKKLMMMFAMVSALNLATPQKSQASVVLIASGNVAVGVIFGLMGGVSGARIISKIRQGSDLKWWDGLNIAACVGAIVLDADGSLPQDQLATTLKNNYKAINNDAFFNSVASLIKAKADRAEFVDGQKTISINSAEFNQLVAPLDTMGIESTVQQMAKDLE